jgi:FKBP-type peptidyl-prolyl cis-trans isomerase
LKEGEGESPPPGNEVVAHYTGTLESDGTEFGMSSDGQGRKGELCWRVIREMLADGKNKRIW